MEKPIELVRLIKVIVFRLQNNDVGDFYDVACQDNLADEFYFGVGRAGKPIVFHAERIGSFFCANGDLDDVVKQIERSKKSYLPVAILRPMLAAVYANDLMFLASAFDKSEFSFYEINPSLNVENYKSTVDDIFTLCAIAEVVQPISVYCNELSGEIYVSDKECENLGWAFAELPEGALRVLIVRPSVYKAGNVVPIPTATPKNK